jgi:transposase
MMDAVDFSQEVTMSMHPHPIDPVPDETARVARAAFPKGNPYLRLRDLFTDLYTDAMFTALYPTRGQPAVAPWRLAVVTVLQFAEGLADRQAADAVRSRIDWKYALSLPLEDEGFDASVLSEFRERLVEGSAESLLLDALLAQARAHGLLHARGRQRTDSTHVLAAIRVLNRLECVGETLRHALDALAVVAPDWLRSWVPAAWFDRYGRPFAEYRLPPGRAERYALAETIGADGFAVLAAVYAAQAPAYLRAVPAVQTLRQVWVQQFYAPTDTVRWRTAEDLPPSALLICTPFDPDARYGKKRETVWTGYKVHLTETCTPQDPHLIVNVETTSAPGSDYDAVETIHTHLAARDLLPQEHIVDAGYVTADDLVASQRTHAVDLLGPVPPDPSWQAKDQGGFATACFVIDWEDRQAICPRGRTSRSWMERQDRHGHPVVQIRFAQADCQACPVRAQCTQAATQPRTLTIRAQAAYEALQAARQRQATEIFKEQYAARAGIEGTISQGVRVGDLRRARYVGQAKTHLQHVLTAAGLNVLRLGAWLAEPSRAPTRRAPFAALAAA